ncbi:hypothetical protein AJ78_08775 [Emergomyces pasteurianus Ep9510]|uniref:Uncharacterized protein n=1 Tax=Emergomyces pasteurianus Ep9510 TaxID=1447872 RepID=A0A1J9Q297_9EURO|nr:hypothetical protein AJ78_08775 [Emergomyces pasteurianus Ep9510]
MPAFHEINSYRLFNNELNYIKNVFSEHSDNNTERIKRINSDNSENSKNNDDSDDSDEEISENDKISSLKHYKTEKTTLNIYKQDISDSIDSLIMTQAQDMIKLITDKKKLSCKKRLEKSMYINDLTKYLRVLLIMNDIEFLIDWLRVELILFCQVTSVMNNQPDALTQL